MKKQRLQPSERPKLHLSNRLGLQPSKLPRLHLSSRLGLQPSKRSGLQPSKRSGLQPSKRLWQQLSELISFFRQMIPNGRRHLCIAFFAGLTGVFFNLLSAYVLKGIYTAVGDGNNNLLLKWAILFVFILAGIFLYNCILWNCFGRSVAEITGHLRRILFTRLCSLRLAAMDNIHSGEVMSVMTSDLDAAQGAYANIRFHVSMILFSAVPSYFVLKTSPPLGFLIIFLSLSQLAVNFMVIRPLERYSKEIRNKLENINAAFLDILKNNMTIRLYCSEDFFLAASKDMNKKLYMAKMRLNTANAAIDGINAFFGLSGYILTLFAGSVLIDAGALNLPDLLFIVQLRLMMVQGILAFGSYAVQMQPAMAGIRKILAFMASDSEDSRPSCFPTLRNPDNHGFRL
jgi:ATP-binding cassette, subfamily B, bacterial